jgi:linoleoyl-CoA desaturase
MNVPVVKYNIKDRPAFFKELKKRVNNHFKDNNISRYGNFNMVAKTIFMLCLYFVPFILMLTGVVSSFWWVMLMWVLMGLGMAGIGFSIMHDANHGSYSKNRRVNQAFGFLINFIGGYDKNWKIQHNVLHHSFTNVEGYDEDIDLGIIRLSPNQERKKFHYLQMFYAPIVYSFMMLNWTTVKDFIQIFKYDKKNLLKGQGLTLKKGLFQVTFVKLGYYALTLVLPLILIDLPWWQILMGYLLMHLICGFIIAFVFQVAHVLKETEFFVTDKTGSVENNWAIHQMKTTSNFANKSVIFSWLIGGLNFQIEHHLFPNICHVHYRKISKIVKQTAEEFNIPYNQHKTFLGAVKSHLSMLYLLGTGKFEKQLAQITPKQ